MDTPAHVGRTYWILIGTPQGPYPVSEIRERLQHGEITIETQACIVGEQSWLPLGRLLDLAISVQLPSTTAELQPNLPVPPSEMPPPALPNQGASTPNANKPTIPSTADRTGFRWALILGIALSVGLAGWLIVKVAEWISPGPERVARKFLACDTALEARKLTTARLHAWVDTIFSDNTPSNPNDEIELTTTIDGPSPQTKLVGFRGTIFVQEAGRRMIVEGHLRLHKQDGWKVDDFVINGMEGVALDGPVSFVDLHNAEMAAKKAAETPPPSTAKMPPTLTDAKKSFITRQNKPTTSDPLKSIVDAIKQDWEKLALGLAVFVLWILMDKSGSGFKRPSKKPNS